jgi:peptide chain release factor 1
MVPLDKLMQISRRSEFLEAAMAQGDGDLAALGREYAELRPVVLEIAAYQQVLQDIDEAEAMLRDPEMKALAEEELPALRAQLPGLEKSLQLALLPKDAADARPAMIEIRPGTGGDEAALFAGDLLRMYQRYAEAQGWKFEIVEMSETELGGIKEVIANIKGEGVFARLKYESGVHRVQRVPETESGGRIHTSAATVAVLPEAQDVDIHIDANDIRIDTMRASGVDSTSTPRIPPFGSPIFPAGSSLFRPRNPSTATARLPCKCCAHGSMMPSAKSCMMNAQVCAKAKWDRAIAPSGLGRIIFRRGAFRITGST